MLGLINSLINKKGIGLQQPFFKSVFSETTPNNIAKKIGSTMIYNMLRDSPSRFTKIIISTILFWTFTKINNIIFMFIFGHIFNIKLSV